MVLLKLNVTAHNKLRFYIYIPIWFYLNQHQLWYKVQDSIIYIPIWFYLNGIRVFERDLTSSIYIPIWFYLNQVERKLSSTILHLHSNMVLLKLEPFALSNSHPPDLHSNMVLLKWY